MEQEKFVKAMKKVDELHLIIKRPVQFTPFSFPLMVDRLSRTTISSESVEDKVAKILAQMEIQD
jgi:ATP-dependent Lhr-like helicase